MPGDLTVIEHLSELRTRIIRALIAVAVTTLLCLPFSSHLLKVLKHPASGTITTLAFFSPQDAFVIYMRVGFLFGFVIALPVVLYQVWAFIAPAVEERFKRYAAFFIVASFAAFIAGCLFAYFLLLPNALRFLLSLGADDLVPVIAADKYISFVVAIILCCGAVFEMPVASFILTKVGLCNARLLRKKFGIALIVIAVIAAVMTPTTDVFNMMLLMLPMALLYEASIWVSFFATPRR